MKNFLKKCIIFVLAVSCIFGVIFSVEYYADVDRFFGRNNNYESYCPIARLNEYEKNPNPYIILGDSRVHCLCSYSDVFDGYAGENYSNLGVGGGTMQDEINLFYWCDSLTELKAVYFEVSFYNIQKNMSADQTSDLLPLVNHPLKYLINRGTLSRTIKFLKTGKKPVVEKMQSSSETVDLSKRTEDIQKHVKNVYRTCTMGTGFEINEAYVSNLVSIAEYCNEKGIRLVFFSPPFQNELFDKVYCPLDIESCVADYKSVLSEKAEFFDMEFISDFSNDPMNFIDSFHVSETGMDEYIRAIVFGEGQIVKSLGQQYSSNGR